MQRSGTQERHPGDPRLCRHRGHRFITLRRFDRAIVDLEKAVELVHGIPDEIEPDGLPNARNQPTSTTQSNIWYHLGLAHYLSADYASAERRYREALTVSRNPDMLCATSYWLYLTLRRLGRRADADTVLAPIVEGLDVIENHAYYHLLLAFGGRRSLDSLAAHGEKHGSATDRATIDYGVGVFRLVNGDREGAIRALQRVLRGPSWAAFGFIAAEVELHRMRIRPVR